MPTLSLNNIPYFRNDKTLQDLNRIVETRSNLMPHELAVAVGCSVQEALEVLMILVSHSLAEAFILVYHSTCPENPQVPFLSRSIYDGLPKIPIVCDICQNNIEDDAELTYKITDAISFTSREMV